MPFTAPRCRAPRSSPRAARTNPRRRLGVRPQRHLQRQLVLPQFHRPVQAEPEAEPVRRHARRSGPAQEAVLLRLLPGHAPGQRPGHHVHLEPHPAAADQRPLRGNPRRQFCPENHMVPLTMDARRPTPATSPSPAASSSTAAIRPPPPPRPSTRSRWHAAVEEAGRLLSDPGAADDPDFGRQCRSGLLVLQPAFHLQRESVSDQRRLSGDRPEDTVAARAYLTTIDQFRTFGSPQGYPGTPIVPGHGTPQALQAHDYVASLSLTSALPRQPGE